MQRIILVYGAIAGAVVIGTIILGLALTGGEHTAHSYQMWLGYLIMLIALSVVFVGIRQHRDRHLGGVIRFGTAMLVGLGISAVAGVIYTAVWEIYLATTDYGFMEQYAESAIADKQAQGASEDEVQALAAEMETMKQRYANPLFRLPMTFLEIFPVGLLITLVSSAVLRNPRVLPARAAGGSSSPA